MLTQAIGVRAQSVQTVHEIKEGETLTQLAKKYGTTVGDIMRLNGMNADSKLYVGEKVKIPEAGVTVVKAAVVKTHVVEKGETLYQLSRKYGVTVNQLRDWNQITGNTIQVGQTLKVSGGAEVVAKTEPQQPAELPPVTQVDPEVENTTAAEQVWADDQTTEPVKQRDQGIFSDAAAQTSVTTSTSAGAEGAFALSYKSQSVGTELITKGLAGTFQSASGWKDGKYFVLMNEVAPGTLVKIQTRGKTVYAKVLWNLGNVKENAGLSYRISDAAASALGITEQQADIIVSYFKEQ